MVHFQAIELSREISRKSGHFSLSGQFAESLAHFRYRGDKWSFVWGSIIVDFKGVTYERRIFQSETHLKQRKKEFY